MSAAVHESCPVAGWAERHPSRVAIRWDGREMTYAELSHRAAQWVSFFARRGVKKGDRVAVLHESHPRLLAQWTALWRLGASLCPLNVRLSPVEWDKQLQSAAPALFLSEEKWQARGVDTQACLIEAAEAEMARETSSNVSTLYPHLPLAHLFTSGTTGTPKLATLTASNFQASARACAAMWGSAEAQRWLLALPLFHVGGLAMATRALWRGGRLELMRRFDEEVVSACIDRGDATHVSLVGTTLQRLLSVRKERPFPESLKVILVGGGPTPAALLRQTRALGGRALLTYGLTEACSQVCTEREGEADAETSGRPIPGVEVKVAGPDGGLLSSSEAGEIWVRGRTVMAGYFNDAEASAQALSDGWLRTGDIGQWDERGHLRVLSRRVDLIVSGGENIYPAEIEAALMEHPRIEEAAVAGRPSDEWGQLPVAAVVMKGAVSDEELAAFCRARLAGFKVPKGFIRTRALPRTATGKIDRSALATLCSNHSSNGTN